MEQFADFCSRSPDLVSLIQHLHFSGRDIASRGQRLHGPMKAFRVDLFASILPFLSSLRSLSFKTVTFDTEACSPAGLHRPVSPLRRMTVDRCIRVASALPALASLVAIHELNIINLRGDLMGSNVPDAQTHLQPHPIESLVLFRCYNLQGVITSLTNVLSSGSLRRLSSNCVYDNISATTCLLSSGHLRNLVSFILDIDYQYYFDKSYGHSMPPLAITRLYPKPASEMSTTDNRS